MNQLVAEAIEITSENRTQTSYTGRTFLAGGDATVDEIIEYSHRIWGDWNSIVIHRVDNSTHVVNPVKE